MLVSVVVCTHSIHNYQDLLNAVDSLLNQTYEEIEIIVVAHGTPELYQRIAVAYGARGDIKVVTREESLGAFGAGNVGVKAASGDIIAFMDDDAVAERRWVENLVDAYEKFNAISVGGKILPIWVSGEPDYLPEELYWLVGATHKGFADVKVVELRNTFGPNMSFRREVFEEVGLFNEKLGFAKRGTSYMQGAEAEFALRMKEKLGKGVIYNPEAIVYHKASPSKLKVQMLLKRAFYQGYSKAILRNLSPSPNPIAVERAYLKDLLLKFIPQRMGGIFRASNRRAEIKKLAVMVASIFSVGLGFVYGCTKRGMGEWKSDQPPKDENTGEFS
jgi:GT2 family glycosyltransferase